MTSALGPTPGDRVLVPGAAGGHITVVVVRVIGDELLVRSLAGLLGYASLTDARPAPGQPSTG